MRALRGLRGRLLLALVATSAVTLTVAAAITLSPLQERLRTQTAASLQRAVEDTGGQFADTLNKYGGPRRGEGGLVEQNALLTTAQDLKERTGARVLVATPWLTPAPGQSWTSFLADTEYGQVSQRDALLVGLQAMLEGRGVNQVDDQDLQVAMPLYGNDGNLTGV